MWEKESKYQEWADAGLISQEQAVAIQNHVASRKAGRFERGLMGLGIFAIVVGVLAIVASNWYQIPGGVKIFVHVVLNFAAAGCAWTGIRDEKPLLRELGALAFFGLTLTLIALVGQVFQLDGSIAGALILWMVISTPFMLITGQGHATAVAWTFGFVAMVQAALGEYLDLLPRDEQIYMTIGVSALLPLALLAQGTYEPFVKCKEAWARVFIKVGIVFSVLSSSSLICMSSFVYKTRYGNTPDSGILLLILLIGALSIGIHALYHKFYEGQPSARAAAILVSAGLFLSLFPPVLGLYSSLFMALLFIAYWVLLGALAQYLGMTREVSLAILVIGIRIFIIYLQVFGSLMSTGFGLITGGVLVFGLIFLMRRVNSFLKERAGGAHV